MATKGNESVNGFLPLSKNYVGLLEKNPYVFEFPDDRLSHEDDSKKIIQSKDCLFLNLLYGLTHATTGESTHTNDFSSLDQDMLTELEFIKPQIEFDFINARFQDKLHLINDTIIPYGFFLKAYVIQKKFRYLNLGYQEKIKRQCELTSCVSKKLNGMLTVKVLNQDKLKKKKKILPIYIFVDCGTSLKHFNNYYFWNNPKSAFLAHYEQQGKNTKRKETSQCRYCDTCFSIGVSTTSTLNIVLVVQVLFAISKITKLKATRIT